MVLGMTCGVHYNTPFGVGARARFKELLGPGYLAGEVRLVRPEEEWERCAVVVVSPVGRDGGVVVVVGGRRAKF